MSRSLKKTFPRPCAGGAGGICAVKSGLFFIFYPLFKGQKCLVGILFQLLGERFKGGKGHFIAEAAHEMEGQGLIVEIAVETYQVRLDGNVRAVVEGRAATNIQHSGEASFGNLGPNGIDTDARDEQVGVGRTEVGRWETDAAAHPAASRHRTAEGERSAKPFGSPLYVARIQETANGGRTDGELTSL